MAELMIMVLGAGDRGRALTKGWGKVDGAKVIEVVDPDTARAEALAGEVGARSSGDYQTAIPQSAADVVVVATPAFLHRPAAELAAACGKHVLSEKPIALNLADADAIIAATEQAGVTYAVCHQLRHGAAFRKAKELILGGVIGRPVQVRSNYLMPVRPKTLMHSRTGNGGPVIDFVCHRFDWWGHLFECAPQRVMACGFTFADDKPELASITDFAIDTASFVVEYESGDIWGCNISWGVPPGVSRPGFEDVIGRSGALVIGMQEIKAITRDGAEQTWDGLGTDLDAAVCQNLADVIRGGGEPVVTGRAAREALRGSLAVLQSIDTGRAVEWPAGAAT